jgi:hypothetical protein
MARKHLIISGTGRSGTTFLVQLYTALGLDTGFTDATAGVNRHCQAGLEWGPAPAGCPLYREESVALQLPGRGARQPGHPH